MKRGFSPAATAAFATTFLVLAIIGWSIGWLAGGAGNPVSQESPEPTATSRPAQVTKSPTPSPTPSKTPSASTTAVSTADAFPMPNVVGKEFREARAELLALKVGVEVHFNAPSERKQGTVERQEAKAGVLIQKGWTMQLYVSGSAPYTTMPNVVGKACTAAKDELVDIHGFKIDSYPSGTRGKVTKIEPTATAVVVWGTSVKLYCVE